MKNSASASFTDIGACSDPLDHKTSSSKKEAEDTKKLGNRTDANICQCKTDNIFFDKLLCYLEKQSVILARCCANSQEHRERDIHPQIYRPLEHKGPKDSRQKYPRQHPSSKSTTQEPNNGPCKNDELGHPSEDNPFNSSSRDRQQNYHTSTNYPALHRYTSSNKSLNKNARSNETGDVDGESLHSKYKSGLNLGETKSIKLADQPCNIYVEVCSCKKGKKAQKQPKAMSDCYRDNGPPPKDELDLYSVKYKSVPTGYHSAQKHSTRSCDEHITVNTDHQCEKKVNCFLKLVEEICEGYIRQCQGSDDEFLRSMLTSKQSPSREDFLQQYPSKPCTNMPKDGRQIRPEKLMQDEFDVNYSNKPFGSPISIEVECEGTKREIIVDPCQCTDRSPIHAAKHDDSYGRVKPTVAADDQNLMRVCLEVFDEKYGKILHDIHDRLCQLENPYTAGYPNPYGDGSPQPQHQQPAPTQQRQLPTSQKEPLSEQQHPLMQSSPSQLSKPQQPTPQQPQHPQKLSKLSQTTDEPKDNSSGRKKKMKKSKDSVKNFGP